MCPQRIFGLAIVALVTLGGRVAAYSNQWAVHIEGGSEVAQQVARDHGFQYLDKVGTRRPFLFSFKPLCSESRDHCRHTPRDLSIACNIFIDVSINPRVSRDRGSLGENRTEKRSCVNNLPSDTKRIVCYSFSLNGYA